MTNIKQRIGIIGGAGPMAGALLFEKIIEVSQWYGCKVDADFPFCSLINYPFAPMLTQGYDENVLSKQLEECFSILLGNGVTIAAIACNTLHAFLPSVPNEIRLIHMIEETKSYLELKGWDNPLILCSSTSARNRLHARYFNCRYPEESLQQTVDHLIDRITEGCCFAEASALLSNKCENEGAIVLGCTELSLLHNRAPLALSDICTPDSIVAEKIVRDVFDTAMAI